MRHPSASRACIALLIGALSACGRSPAPSTAADDVIATADDAEEREGLTQARDDIDDEMRRTAAAKDAEIERLRRENAALRKKLGR